MNVSELLPLRDEQADLFGALSRREVYAALAMLGLCARNDSQHRGYKGLAKEAVGQADALIAELAGHTA